MRLFIILLTLDSATSSPDAITQFNLAIAYPLNYSTSNNVPNYDITEVKQALIDIRDQQKSSYTSRVLICLSFLRHDEHINVQRDIDSMEKALKGEYSFDCYRIDIHQNDERGRRLWIDVQRIIWK